MVVKVGAVSMTKHHHRATACRNVPPPHRSDVRFQGARTHFSTPRLSVAVVRMEDEVVQGRRRARWTSVDML
jgi:hypothetical protein